MAKVPARRSTTKINPIFFIPDGVDELTYTDLDPTLFEMGDGLVGDFDAGIPTPKILGIVSQTIRRIRGGGTVVDIVIEVEDIPGITKYEFRVARDD